MSNLTVKTPGQLRRKMITLEKMGIAFKLNGLTILFCEKVNNDYVDFGQGIRESFAARYNSVGYISA